MQNEKCKMQILPEHDLQTFVVLNFCVLEIIVLACRL